MANFDNIQNADNDRKTKNVVKYAILGVLLLIYIVTQLFLSSARSKELAVNNKLNADIVAVQNQISKKKVQGTDNKVDIIKESTGMDQVRVARDYKIAEEFIRKVTSWTNYAEYDNMRESIKNEYGLSDTSSFMTGFLPKIEQFHANDGSTYNRIDTFGYNLVFENMEIFVSKIDEKGYHYFSYVNVSSRSNNGGEALGKVVFGYTINEEGKMSDIEAWGIADLN